MLSNYLLLAIRNLRTGSIFSIINIVGLSIGMTVALLILNYVFFEHSYDSQHTGGDDIYRVGSVFKEGDVVTDDWAVSAYGYGPMMVREIPGVENMCRVDMNAQEQIVSYEEKKFRESRVTTVDSSFFEMFSFRLTEGDPASALCGPYKVIINDYVAFKYFGSVSPIGKVMRFNSDAGYINCEVTGILEPIPSNSHINFDFFISYESMPLCKREFWYMHETYTYVQLATGVDPASVEAAFPLLAERNKTDEALRTKTWAISLTPLAEIYLTPKKQHEWSVKGDKKNISVLIMVALAILTIAWINYINLTTARFLQRAKEVSIRKVSGALRRHLITQFMFESLLINLISFVVAVLLISALYPWFNLLIGKDITFVIFSRPIFWITIVATFVFGTIASGFYPAFVISSVKPISILKGKYVHTKGAGVVRKVLVVLQFAAALVLICSTAIIYQQLRYMQAKPLGVDFSNTFTIKYPAIEEGLGDKISAFKRDASTLGGVSSVALSNSVPGMEVAVFASNSLVSAGTPEMKLFEMVSSDYDFLTTYDMKIVDGRGWAEDYEGDLSKTIINESAAREFGFATNAAAIGKKVVLETIDTPAEIVGVVADYHQQGLNAGYTPIMFVRDGCIDWVPLRFISVKSEVGKEDLVLAEVGRLWQQFFPESTFDSFFVDKFYARQYVTEHRFGYVFGTFAALALFISVMGLWILTLFSTMSRRKEMGLRKIFGASALDIFGIQAREYLYLSFAAILVGLPAAWYFMSGWLSDYAFRTDLVWWVFVVPVVILLLISMGTVAYQIIRTMLANPVKSLRCE